MVVGKGVQVSMAAGVNVKSNALVTTSKWSTIVAFALKLVITWLVFSAIRPSPALPAGTAPGATAGAAGAAG